MTAELALLNAKIWTGDPRRPHAQAVAARDGRIVAVGADAEVRRSVGVGATVIDCAGRRLVPGFNDAHAHMLHAGKDLLGTDLRAAKDEGEFVKLLGDDVRRREKGAWLTHGKWDHEAWPSRRWPTRELIDPVSRDNPVLLHRLDGHIAVANSLALRLAGVTAGTADPPGGRIVRDERTGEPTGVLIDTATDLVGRAVPPDTDADRLNALRAALRHAAGLGVTSLQCPCGLEEYRLCQRLRRDGELTARVRAVLPPDQIQTVAGEAQSGDDWLATGAIKLFADGSFGAASAWLFEPYEHDPASCGLAMHQEKELDEIVARIDRAGLQAAVHAIGDRAVHVALNAFENAARANGRRDSRHRIEHAQMVRPEDRPRFAELGVVASIQPSHAIDDMRWIKHRIGERCRYAYPYASLAQAGARIAIGTDWYVEPLDPMLTLYAAVTRESAAGGPAGGWLPEERVTVEQALRDYTAGSAYAEFQESRKGTIQPGMLADVVLLSKDILAVESREILSARVEITIVGGRVVFP